MSRSLALFSALVIGVAFGTSSAHAGRDRSDRAPARAPSGGAEPAPAQAIVPSSQGTAAPQWQTVGSGFDARQGRVPLERRSVPTTVDMRPRTAPQQPTFQAQPNIVDRRAVDSRQPIGLASDPGVTSRSGRDVPRRADVSQGAGSGALAPAPVTTIQPMPRDARAVDVNRGSFGDANANQGTYLPRSVMGPGDRGAASTPSEAQPAYRRAVGERAAIDRPAPQPMVSQPQQAQWRNVGTVPNVEPVIRSEAARAVSARSAPVAAQAYPASSPVTYYRPQPVERSSRSSFSIGVGYSDYSSNSSFSTSFSYSSDGYRQGYYNRSHHYYRPAPVYAIPAATVVTYPTYSYYTPYYCPPPVLVAPSPVVYVPPPVYYVTPAPVYYYTPSPCYYTSGLSFNLSFFSRF